MSGTDERRIAPLPADQWGAAEHEAVAALFGVPADKVPRAGSGGPRDPATFPVLGVMVRHPDLARRFLHFNNHQLTEACALPERWRELAVLRVAHRQQSPYEWGQHVRIARRLGFTDADLAALARGNESFDGADRAVLEATDELLVRGHLAGEVWDRLCDHLDEHQRIELIFIVGTYLMLAMLFKTAGIPPEPDFAPLPPR